MIKAVIFDLDGTLIDTEKLYRKFWPMAMKEHGFELSDERALFIRSLGRPFAPAQYKEWFGEDFDYYAVRDTRKRIFNEHVEKYGIEAKKGAGECLGKLREMGFITAICTATDSERTDRYLKLAGIDGLFDSIVSATMVTRGKPAPDVYLYACERLGLLPEECIAVEDAPNGIISASDAGLKVIMVPDQTGPDERTEGRVTAVLECLTDIPEFINQLK